MHRAAVCILEGWSQEFLVDVSDETLSFSDWVLLGWASNFSDDTVAVTEFLLEMLVGTETTELAVDHDGESCAERLTLHHAKNRLMDDILTHW